MPDEVSPLAAAYREKIATQIVLIERFYAMPDGRAGGDMASGVIIGRRNQSGSEAVHIGTAAHVLLDAPTQPVRWCVSRVEQRLEGRDARTIEVRVAEFFTQKPVAEEPNLYRPAAFQPAVSGAFDIGMITIPNESSIQGNPHGPKQPFIRFDEHPRLLLTPAQGSLKPGTRVAWGGFPGFVYRRITPGRYHLCYYEGVISAYVPDPTHPVYLVDGHIAKGVSGGPIWFCTPSGDPIIFGVVSGYYDPFEPDKPPERMPGICAFTPVNVLFDHLEKEGVLE